MIGSSLRRWLATPVAVAALLTGVGAAVAAPAAHADRCEPEELVLGPDTSPINENDNPVCTATFFYVYPYICNGDPNNPPLLLQCPRQLSLNPTYQPPIIPPYNPNFGRLTCNIVLFANPNGSCTFRANPTTGITSVQSYLGNLEIISQPAA